MVTERATAIQTKLLFFELEWVEVDDDRAEELLATDGLEFAAHYLRMERRYRPHLLTQARGDDRDRALGHRARRLDAGCSTSSPRRSGSTSRATTSRSPLDVALSRPLRPRPRSSAATIAEAVTEALEPGLRTRAYVFNTLLQDKAIKDRLRHYPHWLATRNLSNEASDESVQALVEAVKGRYELARRWYGTKARAARHRAARRLRPDGRRLRGRRGDSAGSRAASWSSTRSTSFSDRAGEIVEPLLRRALDRRAADARSKRGGAFSASTVPSVHPYVMLNYTDRRRDVLTLAHELGHGLHQTLAREQGVFHQDTPLTVAETASVFAEEIVFGRLLAEADDPASRLGPAGRGGRGPDRDRLPPDRDEPVRGPRPHRAPRRGRARRSSASASSGPRPRPSCSATRSRSPTATAPGGPTSPTSSARRATSTPTRTASCWRSRSTGSTPSAARRWCPATSRCSPPAARARPRSWARSSASTSPTRASGTRASTWSRSSSNQAVEAAEAVIAESGVAKAT